MIHHTHNNHTHIFKMSRTLQQLRTDVSSLQSGLKDLHSSLKISPDTLKVPSWRYPEKMATSVRIQVKECEDSQLLLELLVDRLVLFLQSCVLEMDHGSTIISPTRSTAASGGGSVPLSLSSAVRRFTQGFTQKTSKFKELNKTVDELKDQLSTLQQTVAAYSDIITNELGPSALPVNLTKEYNKPTNTRTISTQTIQTSLATTTEPCLQCPRHIEGQALMSRAVNTLRKELVPNDDEVNTGTGGPPYNTKSTDKGGGEHGLESDLAIIKECFVSCEEQKTSLQEELTSKESMITQLEDQYSEVMRNVTKLQDELHSNQKKYEDDIHIQSTSKDTCINELKSELAQVSTVAEALKRDLISLKKTEAQLRSTLSQKKEEILTLQASFKSSLKEKEFLQKSKKELNEYILSLKRDYKAISLELDEKTLHLNKTSTQLSNMESRCKYLQSKQMKLLSQVDEMDQNCAQLNELLNTTVKEKNDVKEKLTEMTEKCTQTLEELQKEKLLLEQSQRDNDTIRLECSQLQEFIKTTKEQLNEEKGRTHLLMEYPYRATVNVSADYRQSRQHIDANCVRILLLEEQNYELRRQQDTTSTDCTPSLPLEPVRLWENIPKSSHVAHIANSTEEQLHIGSASSLNSVQSDSI